MISSHVKISMISKISSLSLKLHLNSLVYHRNIFGSSFNVFSNLWKSLHIFINCRKFLENVWEHSSGLRNNFGKSSKKNWKVVGNLWKIIKTCRHQYVYIIKRTLHISSKIWILCSHGKNNISLVHCAHS